MNRTVSLCLLGFVVSLGIATPVGAETGELRVAKQYGLGYLQMILMEDQKLVEKHAKAAGLGDVKVSWSTFRSSDVMNDTGHAYAFNVTSEGDMLTFQFMHKIGSIKVRPESWQDLLFPSR